MKEITTKKAITTEVPPLTARKTRSTRRYTVRYLYAYELEGTAVPESDLELVRIGEEGVHCGGCDGGAKNRRPEGWMNGHTDRC